MNRFQFVQDHKDAYGVKRLCEVVEIASSGVKAHLLRPQPRIEHTAEQNE